MYIVRIQYHLLYNVLVKIQNISGPEYGSAMKMRQWHMSHSSACINQDVNGPFEILMGHLENHMGPRNLYIHLTAK